MYECVVYAYVHKDVQEGCVYRGLKNTRWFSLSGFN